MLRISRNASRCLAGALSMALLGCTLGAPIVGHAMTNHQTEDARAEAVKLIEAGAAADQAIARLHATLDIQPVFDEMWVTDPALRDRFLKRFVSEDAHIQAPEDHILGAQLAISLSNFTYLFYQYVLIGDEKPSEIEGCPPEPDLPRRSAHQSEASVIAEANRSIYETNRYNDFMRQHLPSDLFGAITYKSAAAQDKADGEKAGFPRVVRGQSLLGLDEDTPVYVVHRDYILWDFVEENGQYRLVGLEFRNLFTGGFGGYETQGSPTEKSEEVLERSEPSTQAEAAKQQEAVRHGEALKLREAELECDRVIARLHETLDFETMIDEMWVSDSILRKRFFGRVFASSHAGYDPKVAKHLAASVLNVGFLWAQYGLYHPQLPPDIQKIMDSGQALAESGALSLEEFLPEMKRAADLFKQRLPSNLFATAEYGRFAKEVAKRSNDLGFPAVQHGSPELRLGENTTVYAVYRDDFCWHFIEEDGRFRLIEINSQDK
jgi:hypothetical protein